MRGFTPEEARLYEESLKELFQHEYYHDIHCNADRKQPMGCEGCSCTMYQEYKKHKEELRLASHDICSYHNENEMLKDEIKTLKREKKDLIKYIKEIACEDAGWAMKELIDMNIKMED